MQASGTTPLHTAAEGDGQRLQELLDAGLDPSIKDAKGQLVLGMVLVKSNFPMASQLLYSG